MAKGPRASASQPYQTGPLSYIWPPLPDILDSQAMAIFSQMLFIEKMPAAQQNALQLRQIERMLRHAHETVPFYKDRLAGIENIPDGELDEAFFATLPLMTRSDIQDSGSGLHSVRVPPEHGPVYPQKTSGSTGKPVETLTTSLRNIMSAAHTLRAQSWHRLDVTRKNIDIRTTSKPGTDSKIARWSILPWSGPTKRIEITLPISQLFDQFIAEDPASVLSHPYTLMLLAERSQETGIMPGKLREVRSYAGALTPSIRQKLREVWNVSVIDSYSAVEIGIMAHQCPETENLHVQVENVRIEIIDDDGKPCRPGTSGRVVITTLQNYASPLVRYEIGDYAEVGEPCECGRTLPVLSRILGRHRNLVRLKNGERFYPYFTGELASNFDNIRQMHARQKTYDDLDFKVVVTRPFTEREKQEVHALLQKCFRYPFRVHISEVDDIPRAANGKFEDFISDLPGTRFDD